MIVLALIAVVVIAGVLVAFASSVFTRQPGTAGRPRGRHVARRGPERAAPSTRLGSSSGPPRRPLRP